MDQEILGVFLEEFSDLIKILEIEISKYPSNKIQVNEIFRVFHTLKGNSASIEYFRLHKLVKYYCDYFREKQKETKLTNKEQTALIDCVRILKDFHRRIKNGKKGKTIKIIPTINKLD